MSKATMKKRGAAEGKKGTGEVFKKAEMSRPIAGEVFEERLNMGRLGEGGTSP